jgi:membrane-associated protease RseP (regulator of RpoE activity)
VGFDEQVVRPDDAELKALQKQFVCVKRLSMHDVNMNVFDFDYDLTWWGFLISPHERVYSRIGGSSDGSPISKVSIASIKHTMRLALEEHKRHGNEPPAEPIKVTRPVDLFGSKGKCMHCHQVNEAFYKADKIKKVDYERLRFLPPPENLGLTMVYDEGNLVESVKKDSAADKAGVRANDVLRAIRGTPILSQGDIMWALKYAPKAGPLPISIERDKTTLDVSLDLTSGWKATDLAWRRSVSKLKK